MKKLLFLGILILLSTAVYASCYDDDGGINYRVKGTCKDTNETEGTDRCLSSGLVEYYCNQNICKAQLKQCTDCKDGVCLSKEGEDVVEVNRPPEVELYILATPGKTEAAFKAVVSDPEKEMVLFTIEFGDGNKASNKADVIHDYVNNGNYTVKITARDASGGTTAYEKEVTITKKAEMVEAPVKEETKQEEGKVGFFTKIINWFKGLFS